METIFDWLSAAVFIALALLYLQRSAMPEPPDRVWHYLPPAIGCAVSNYAGNKGFSVLAVLGLAAVVAYILKVLRPRIVS